MLMKWLILLMEMLMMVNNDILMEIEEVDDLDVDVDVDILVEVDTDEDVDVYVCVCLN
jgi:hypothetical protein